MESVTKDKLQKRVDAINNLCRKGPGPTTVGLYMLDGPYSGFRLVQVTSDRGTERDISPRLSKSRLYEWLWAYEDGIRLGMELKSKESDQ